MSMTNNDTSILQNRNMEKIMIKKKRATITLKNEAKIKEYARKFRNIKRTPLAETMLKEIKWIGLPPEIEVLERKISGYRSPSSASPNDKPWGLASLSANPIHPEALPKVLEVFVEKLLSTGLHLTVREAKWVASLAFLPLSREHLCLAALDYANCEALAEVKDVDVGDPMTGLLDDTLIIGDMDTPWEEVLGKSLGGDDMEELRRCIREEWDRYKAKEKKLMRKMKKKEVEQ